MMKEIPVVEEGRRRYGSKLLTAAIGAIEKSDGSFRVIHDATHGVQVNQRIQQRDQVRSPGLAEANTIMRQARKLGTSVLGLKGGVSKAHRRCRVREQDHCYQVCQLRPETLWLNLLGPSGSVRTASYWWSRLEAHGGGGAWSSLPTARALELAAGLRGRPPLALGRRRRPVELAAVRLVPHHLRHAFLLDEVQRQAHHWAIGWARGRSRPAFMSESRARWLIGWIDSVLAEGSVLVGSFSEALGRLGFAAGALPCFRPFLGPLYTWSSAVPGGAFVEVPVMIKITLRYLKKQISNGYFMTDCGEAELVEVDDSRADAQAEGEDVAMVGRECRNDTPPESARWWYLRINRKDHPWVYAGGESYRKIATLELIATLLSDLAFSSDDDKGFKKLRLVGATDNLGNKGAVARCMTTSFPLCAAHMESWSSRRGKQNVDVKSCYGGLHASRTSKPTSSRTATSTNSTPPLKRIHIRCDEDSLPIMHEMIKYGRELYDEVNKNKLEKQLHKGSEGAKHSRPGSAALAAPGKRQRRGLKESDSW